MASLPHFEKFTVHADESSVGIRWRKWVAKFENLLCGLNITSDDRKKALLLHYAGDEVFEIYDAMTDEQKGVGAVTGDDRHANEYPVLKKSLTDYFTPHQNTAFETFKFRQATQALDESIDSFHTRLRSLASHCEFHDTDREILSQIIQGCKNSKLRRKALKDNLSLTDTLKEARAQELAESRAAEIEAATATINAVQGGHNRHPTDRGETRPSLTQHADASSRPCDMPSTRGGARFHGSSSPYGVTPSRGGAYARGGAFSRGRGTASSSGGRSTCRYCGGGLPHLNNCPARGKECRRCFKIGHFARVCESSQKVRALHTPQYTESDANDDAATVVDESVFTVGELPPKTPVVTVQMFNKNISFVVDTGATVNILTSQTVDKLGPQARLCGPCPLIYAYGSDTPLHLKGFIFTDIVFRNISVHAKFYVVNTDNSPQRANNLLSSRTAQALNILQFAMSADTPPPSTARTTIPDEFPSLFDTSAIGHINGKTIKLHIDHTVKPVAQLHRRIPFHIRKDVETELERLERLDIIERVQGPTPWVSPIVVVPKKEGNGVRLCIDMREANRAIQREKHPMPTIDDLITDLNGSKMFSKLDMTNAYHQLELDEDSRMITTFTTHVGLRRYKRLLFGVNTAAEIFQKTISELLVGIPGARNLSDDIIVHGRTQEEHDVSLKATLKKLNESGAKLNKDKCVFSVRQLKFYGHVFGESGISPDDAKIQSMVDSPPPASVAEVRSFLGMTQYVSRFIPAYSTLTEPLRRLTKNGVPWQWGREQQDAFAALKQALTGAKVMVYFDPAKRTEVIVDASPVGLGAILCQDGHPVSYAGRSLTDTEQRYSQTDKEMLAVVFGVEKFHLYVYGASFTVRTDHKPLLGIVKGQKPTTARIERLRLRLLPYDMQLTYTPGRDDKNPADFLSRHSGKAKPSRDNASEQYIAYVTHNNIPKAMTVTEIRDATEMDHHLQKVMRAVQSGKWNDPDIAEFSQFKDEISVHGGLVLRGHRLIIPATLQKKVVHIAHQSHQGIVKTKQHIREKVWFPGIDRLVEETVKACIPCQASYPGPLTREPIIPTPLPTEPWSSLAVDFVGPFPGGEYLFVVIDEHSRYPEVEIVSSTSHRVVLPKLGTIFSRQGFPHKLKTDNGPPFNGQEFSNFLKEHGIMHQRVTPLWPEANGEAERFMRTLNKNIRASEAANENWKTQLPTFLMHYRSTPHSSTSVSPFEALTGRKMNTGIPGPPLSLQNPIAHPRIAQNDFMSKHKMTTHANARRHTKPSGLDIGDTVLVKQPKTNKLTPPFNPKPMTIVAKNGSMLTAQRGYRRIVRNSSFFKAVPPPINDDLSEEEEDEEDMLSPRPTPDDTCFAPQNNLMSFAHTPATPQASRPAVPRTPATPGTPTMQMAFPDSTQPTPLPPAPVQVSGPNTPASRPVRVRKKPEYLKDYVP